MIPIPMKSDWSTCFLLSLLLLHSVTVFSSDWFVGRRERCFTGRFGSIEMHGYLRMATSRNKLTYLTDCAALILLCQMMKRFSLLKEGKACHV